MPHGDKRNVSRFFVLSGQILLVDAVRQGSGGGVVEESEAVESRNGTGIQKASSLSISKERGYLKRKKY